MAKFDGTAKDLQDVRKMTGDLSGDETNYPNVKAVEQAKQQAITESKNYTDTQIGEIPEPVLDHNKLTNRGMLNQHPVIAITGLQEKTSFGSGSFALSGGAIGKDASTMDGGSIGDYAISDDGGAVGKYSTTENGGAVGANTESIDGFAGGSGAKSTAQHSIQLGTGTNAEEGTMYVSNGAKNYKMMNADGTIPPERLPDVGTTDYADLTNKPKINGVELVGDKTSVDLGVASAIKNTVSGSVVAVNDVAEKEHNVEVKVESKTVTDLTQVKVNVLGANLFDKETAKDGRYDANGNLRSSSAKYQNIKIDNQNKIYLSGIKNAQNNYITICQFDENLKFLKSYIPTEEPFQMFDLQPNCKILGVSVTTSNVETVCVSFYQTEPVPYKCTEYTPLQDGTVPNVKSVSPDMTMFGEGINITATYNADTKRYIGNLQTQIDELKKAILSTGGNI